MHFLPVMPPPLQRPEMFLISCSFVEILAKPYFGAPWKIGGPTYGESWIHPAYSILIISSIQYFRNT